MKKLTFMEFLIESMKTPHKEILPDKEIKKQKAIPDKLEIGLNKKKHKVAMTHTKKQSSDVL